MHRVRRAGTPTTPTWSLSTATDFPGSPFPRAEIQDAATHVLDAAYTALWAIRSNDPAWRNRRTTLGWIAVSGFDDTPHRPVNVPTAPYPQYDLDVTVPGHPETTSPRVT